ncbi:hypothetical protein K502DRAFT_310289, partial [Neoconidiobolus thromboides FSU 785]
MLLKALNPLKIVNKHRVSKSSGNISPCNIPPIYIIRAKGDYHARKSEELSFMKGDLFHVIGESDNDYYSVCNPLTNKVGLVPIDLFEIIKKCPRSFETNNTTVRVQPRSNNTISSHSCPESSLFNNNFNNRASYTTFIAKALYDFDSEREDELGFKKGDLLIVLAQSTEDWFVARLLDGESSPGLVPVSYLELRDKNSGEKVDNFSEYLRDKHISLPSVMEWKTMTTSSTLSMHSTNSIIEPQSPASVCSSYSYMPNTPLDALTFDFQHGMNINKKEKEPLDTAHVTSFIADEGNYIFIIQLRFESSGKQRTLYRDYDAFFELHTGLIRQFPKEAGRFGDKRIIPYMPGPLSQVDDKITTQRRIDLDLYLQQLFLLPQQIQNSELFRSFFKMKKGDYESNLIPNLLKNEDNSDKNELGDIKVKVNFRGDLIAFKMPKGSSNFDLQKRVCERFGDEVAKLTYRDFNGDIKPL